jgi:predicted DNA-binding transcriptional regulator YafY
VVAVAVTPMSVPLVTVWGVRASRLVAELLLLQRRGLVTAAQVAAELECSERTVYRDMQSLGEAGIPVYAERGGGGGFRLVDGYRTRLTGLTRGEAEALFLSVLPAQAAELGRSEAAMAARHKVLASLPDRYSAVADAVQRFHLDAPGWFRTVATPSTLPVLADAVWGDRQVRIGYRRDGGTVRRTLEPHGVVLKQGVWYVVARVDASWRSYRVDRVAEAEPTGERFDRDPAFDLEAWWDRQAAAFEVSLLRHHVTVRLSPHGRRRLAHVVEPVAAREALSSATAVDDHGWTTVRLPTEALDFAAEAVIALGADAEAVDPPEFRQRVASTLRAAADRYRGDGPAEQTA